ncbi:MAG: hypothetical protein AAF719_11915 [Pseudomonadota bacterium]
MKSSIRVIVAAVLVSGTTALSGCQSVAAPASSTTSYESGDYRMAIKWCELSADRTAECAIEATSLYQTMKGQVGYANVEDQDGNPYRMAIKADTTDRRVMAPGQAYVFHFTVDNLPTYATELRGFNVTFIARDPQTNLKRFSELFVFSNIPARPPKTPVETTVVVDDAPVAPPPETSPPPAPSQPGLIAAPGVSGSYWFATITPTVPLPEDDVVRAWKKGAYFHFRPDGVIGFNWSEPDAYAYDTVNAWSEAGDSFTIKLTDFTYVFDAQSPANPLTAPVQPGGFAEMQLSRKAMGQR